MDNSITRLNQRGKIYFWKFRGNQKNYPGWNISFNEDGANFLFELLTLMDHSRWSSKKVVDITEPEQKILLAINNLKGNAPLMPVKKLNLKFEKSENDLWRIEEQGNQIDLSFGSDKLNELRNAISNKVFDVGITDLAESSVLYVWSI